MPARLVSRYSAFLPRLKICLWGMGKLAPINWPQVWMWAWMVVCLYVSPAMGWWFVQDAPRLLPKGRWEGLTAGFFLIVVSGVENEEDKEEEIPKKHLRSNIFLSKVAFHSLACRRSVVHGQWSSMGKLQGVEGGLWILVRCAGICFSGNWFIVL